MIPNKKASDMTRAELGAYIDQSVLKPEFTQGEIRKYIQEGIDYQCKTVCINPASIPMVRELCANTKVGLCVVCDFPFCPGFPRFSPQFFDFVVSIKKSPGKKLSPGHKKERRNEKQYELFLIY
ncbi:MAG: hypothetical protein LBR99_00320 [Treponema sp.]|jgi:hypothetical protein|nr:hypothetical protein [Treponema sp.]